MYECLSCHTLASAVVKIWLISKSVLGKLGPELDVQKEILMFFPVEMSLIFGIGKAEQHHSSRILSLWNTWGHLPLVYIPFLYLKSWWRGWKHTPYSRPCAQHLSVISCQILMTPQWGRSVGLQLNPKEVSDPSRSHQQEVASCVSPLKPTPLWSKPLGNLLGALIFIFLEISGVSEFPHSYYGCRVMAESCSLAPKELVLWAKLCVL